MDNRIHNLRFLRYRLSIDTIRGVKAFFSSDAKGKRFALGRNEHSQALADVIDLDGFVDDFAEPGTLFLNKPVLKSQDLHSESFVVNCALCAGPISAEKNLLQSRSKLIIKYSDICHAAPEILTHPSFVQETIDDFKSNFYQWENLFQNLHDEKSKSTLCDVLTFRLTGDYEYMRAYSYRPHDQYFDDVMIFKDDEVFVDCGGYDGLTTELFCKKCPSYKQVFFFEPVTENMLIAKKRLNNFQNIKYCEYAVSDQSSTLQIDKFGSASKISDNGDICISSTTLDKYIKQKCTFIKMDLEGWEQKAISGCKKHLKKNNPKLAIAVYHHAHDFWKIYNKVLEYNCDYKLHLRHYTEGWSESVMYFIPGKQI